MFRGEFMKKRLILGLLMILTLIPLTGCGKDLYEEAEANGNIYNMFALYDKGVDMFEGVVPSGWTAQISSQDMVNSSHPFVETVVLTNPEETARIIIISQHSYVENNRYNEGVNQDYYTTYLHQMDASTYLDYFMNNQFPGSTFVQNVNVDSRVLSQLEDLHNMKVAAGKQDALQLQAQNYGVYITVNGAGFSSSKKQYQNGSNYYEASTSVSSISTTLNSSLSSLLDSYAVQWYMPYVIVYEAVSKEAFDEYYDTYNFIITNSNFTVDYYAMVEYVSSAIVNAYTSYYAAKSKAGLDAMNDYIDSNYSSTSSQSTNDKVMEMWDDVINEVDKYQLEDGTTLKTSMYNETVAQNGNEIYIGSKAGIPNGFTEVYKGY